ncbi:MAG: ATP-grasp domain-containing protein [Proteobacteria bacterium]|nr:ATP-grasp domain-containing protein [Pseudomonadota bacterium]
MLRDRVLVVATTSDYVDLLRKSVPGQVLFLTGHDIRKGAVEPSPDPEEEILCDPTVPEIAIMQLKQHLRSHSLRISGITCFDCESMDFAARIGEVMDLSYPSAQSIRDCRDKSRTKELWRENHVPCPRSERVSSVDQVRDFFREVDGPCVLKPVDGSGSERVFCCKTALECEKAFGLIRAHQYSPAVMMEEFASGTEYSCDFMVDGDRVQLIRMTRKIHAPGDVFGTIMAYEVIDFLPDNISRNYFLKLMGDAARSLGIKRAICMVDFIVNGSHITLLELAPRPGGDCLPWLIQRSMDLDMLKLAVDFAQNTSYEFKKSQRFSPHIGLRIHAKKAGALKSIDCTRVLDDTRVTDVLMKHRPGHKIIMPPADYDSWNMGHIIFKPLGLVSPHEQCRELLSFLRIEIDHETERSKQRSSSTGSVRPQSKAFPAAG